MATSHAIAAVGKSLEHVLTTWFQQAAPLGPERPARAYLARSNDFENKGAAIGENAVSIFLYRVELNKTMRAAWAHVGQADGRSHLALDLHFLLTAWASNAEHEHALIGCLMEYLDRSPMLTGPQLHASAGWAPGEAVQVVPGEMTTEEVMRTFDALPTDYRLSVPYVARVVRIDSSAVAHEPPVTDTTTRIERRT